jgi:hypothetical protein
MQRMVMTKVIHFMSMMPVVFVILLVQEFTFSITSFYPHKAVYTLPPVNEITVSMFFCLFRK